MKIQHALMNANRTATRTAFTLVELLMVIAIISVLAALLLPALSNAMESARKAECANRMRQLAITCDLYEQEARCILPAFYTPKPISTYSEYGLTPWQLLLHAGYLEHEYAGYFRAGGNYDPKWGTSWVNNTLRASSPLLCPSGYWNSICLRSGFSFSPKNTYGWSGTEEEMKRRDSCRWYQQAQLYNGTLIRQQWIYDNWPTSGYTYPALVASYGYNQHLVSRFGQYSGSWDFQPQGICLDGRPTKALRQAKHPASKQLRFIEGASQQWIGAYGPSSATMRRQGDLSFTSGQFLFYCFRIPHIDTTNFINLDGHIGSIDTSVYAQVYYQNISLQEDVLEPYFRF